MIYAMEHHLPLYSLLKWSPFRLDALGLVTLLGAEEVSRAIGGLQHTWLAEYLPLMGAYMVAGNKFTEPLAGYTASNITNGIIPPELNGPFTRWLYSNIPDVSRQQTTTTTIHWSLVDEQGEKQAGWRQMTAVLIGFTFHSALIALTVLIADWYGLANSISMAVSVAVRWFLIRQNRLEMKKKVDRARKALKAAPAMPKVKILVQPPNSDRIVVNYIQGALIPCLILPLDNPRRRLYRLFRFAGWLAFAVHIISIGQSSLVAQLITVATMTFATMATVYRIGCETNKFGHLLKTESFVVRQQKRMNCYVDLDPNPEEEMVLKQWFLMPLPSAKAWFESYERLKTERENGKVKI